MAALSCASQQIRQSQAASMASKDVWHRKRTGQMVLALLYLILIWMSKILSGVHGLLPRCVIAALPGDAVLCLLMGANVVVHLTA